jgi:hypothetical protein
MKLEYPLHPSEPCRIVEDALNTLGLDFHFLALLTGTELGYVERRLVSSDLGVTEWISLCDALLLNAGCYSYGYIYTEHCIRINNAIIDGYFNLPKTCRFWALRFKHWKK